jgi:TonB family protein
MDVTDVLRDRMQEPAGLQAMAVASAIAHGALILGLIFLPGGLLSERNEEPRTVMTISLGGAPGPDSGGMTNMGGRPVQAEAPVEPKRPEPVRPPAARTPEMTVPAPNARPARTAPAAPVKEAPPDATGRTPVRGAETRPGSTAAETGVRGQGFGLSTGGGGGTGSRLDVGDFCCPEYLSLMTDRIRANWSERPGPIGITIMRFTIQRTGQITDVAVEKTSGNPILDTNAQRALLLTKQLPALPAAFPNPTLTVYLNFEYTR